MGTPFANLPKHLRDLMAARGVTPETEATDARLARTFGVARPKRTRGLFAGTPKPRRGGGRNARSNALNAAAIAYLKLKGCDVWRNNTAKGFFRRPSGAEQWMEFGRAGLSDVLGMTPTGHIMAVETKTPRDTLKPDQREFLADVTVRGGFACAIRDIGELERAWAVWEKAHPNKETK